MQVELCEVRRAPRAVARKRRAMSTARQTCLEELQLAVLEQSQIADPRVVVSMGENLAGTEVWVRIADPAATPAETSGRTSEAPGKEEPRETLGTTPSCMPALMRPAFAATPAAPEPAGLKDVWIAPIWACAGERASPGSQTANEPTSSEARNGARPLAPRPPPGRAPVGPPARRTAPS